MLDRVEGEMSIGKKWVSFSKEKIIKRLEVKLAIMPLLRDKNDECNWRHVFYVTIPGRGLAEVFFRGVLEDATPFYSLESWSEPEEG